ncbi:uncharacterized protein LOC131995711 [Stomoxys calcitrans]|uniref:Uncharacterized protein n=1 Tax=Stomoxys calcitrans TaxID=35570 RepID=A0A1I8PG94_STOCA|nr:uncharacterized protein LOC106083882 [Stomoxys calcitrans]XP_059220626.1 uncharacterized protein LOC131995711 [Stomoxys calcitrans]
MFKTPLGRLAISCLLFTFCVIKLSQCGVINTPVISDDAKEDFEREARLETEEFLNNIFTAQIEFFNKLKQSLKSDTKRYKDFELLVERLELTKQEKELEKKDVMYWETFQQFNKSPLLLNEPTETGMSDEEYQKALTDNGFKELLKNFFADVAVYFWKMAKASGKVVETAMDEYLEQMQKSKSLI